MPAPGNQLDKLAQLKPWWTFDRIDDFGTIDKERTASGGTYWKPDSNIQLSGGYPIENLLPGTVTSIQQTDYGQTVVTVKLDDPLNSLATHEFYEHMSASDVSIGQHLNTGDLVGLNNPSGQVPLGYGFYSGDVYGQGAAWTQLQQDLAPGGAGLLNPVKVLDAAKSGQPVPGTGQSTQYGGGGQNDNPFTQIGNALQSLSSLSNALGPWIQSPTRILKMAVGVLLVGIALLMLIAPDVIKGAPVVGKAAAMVL